MGYAYAIVGEICRFGMGSGELCQNSLAIHARAHMLYKHNTNACLRYTMIIMLINFELSTG